MAWRLAPWLVAIEPGFPDNRRVGDDTDLEQQPSVIALHQIVEGLAEMDPTESDDYGTTCFFCGGTQEWYRDLDQTLTFHTRDCVWVAVHQGAPLPTDHRFEGDEPGTCSCSWRWLAAMTSARSMRTRGYSTRSTPR